MDHFWEAVESLLLGKSAQFLHFWNLLHAYITCANFGFSCTISLRDTVDWKLQKTALFKIGAKTGFGWVHEKGHISETASLSHEIF